MLPLDPPLTPAAARTERHPLRQISEHDRRAIAASRQDPDARARFGSQLLTSNPDSILGRLLVAEAAPTNAETEALLRDAVRIGLKLWGPELNGRESINWFDDPDTRIFMAAVSAYGRTLHRRGLEREARDCADFLLGLDPSNRLDVEQEIMGTPPGGSQRPSR
jgi:hypothetical protein